MSEENKQIKCKFTDTQGFLPFDEVEGGFSVHPDYYCLVCEEKIPENIDIEFSGQHFVGKSNNDVTFIQFDSCELTKVPQGLTKIFPKLNSLAFKCSNLKHLSKSDLIEYKNLRSFDFSMNEIEFLPGDLFDGFKNLKQVYFGRNGLKIIEPNFIDGLDSLTNLYLGDFSEHGYICANSKEDAKQKTEKLKAYLMEKFLKLKSETVIEYFLKQQNNTQMVKDLNEKLIQVSKNLIIELEIEKLKNPGNSEKFKSHLKNFIQDETTKDFKITIDDREFPVHKFLLAARSPTLAEILRNNPEVENLNLVDISEEIFEKILKFLYTDELPCEDGMDFSELFEAAGKLRIAELMDFAAEKIITEINEDNALFILKLSNKYESNELRQKAFDELKKKYPKIEVKDEWITDGAKVVKAIEFFEKMNEAEVRFKTCMMMMENP